MHNGMAGPVENWRRDSNIGCHRRQECPRFEHRETWGSRFRGGACGRKSGPAPSRDAQACDSMEVIHLGPNAARRIAPIIMSDPPAVAINPTDIRNPPNAVLGPQGPNPVAKVSANAATPTPKEITPYVAMFFTVLF